MIISLCRRETWRSEMSDSHRRQNGQPSFKSINLNHKAALILRIYCSSTKTGPSYDHRLI